MAINIKPSRKGLLHEKLGIPMGKKISLSKLAGAKQSKSPGLLLWAHLSTTMN